ncbi:ATP-dependent zinc protease family protein [Oceaniferula spumae]
MAQDENKPEVEEPATSEEKAVPVEEPKKKTRVYGWKEWVWVVKPEIVLRAKLDTGARTCSIHATNLEPLEIDGKKWVKFTISEPDSESTTRLRYKAPVLRMAKVKNDSGGLDIRYVVPLVFQIGDQKFKGEFTLNDRSTMTCAVLIGRNLLQQLGHVDASRTDLLPKPKKPAPAKKKAPEKVPAGN